MPFFDEISKRFGMNKGADKGARPRRVANNGLPPPRLWPSDDYEARPMRHGVRQEFQAYWPVPAPSPS